MDNETIITVRLGIIPSFFVTKTVTRFECS